MHKIEELVKNVREKQKTQLTDTQRVEALVKGLSTATTIAQIRSVAKQILDETGGDGE